MKQIGDSKKHLQEFGGKIKWLQFEIDCMPKPLQTIAIWRPSGVEVGSYSGNEIARFYHNSVNIYWFPLPTL